MLRLRYHDDGYKPIISRTESAAEEFVTASFQGPDILNYNAYYWIEDLRVLAPLIHEMFLRAVLCDEGGLT